MPEPESAVFLVDNVSRPDGMAEELRQESLLKTGALQNAIFNSANFSSIATDARGVIQIFNVGAERMLGYAAADVMNKITPADTGAGCPIHSCRKASIGSMRAARRAGK